jgi:small subunit ribosomal protein S9
MAEKKTVKKVVKPAAKEVAKEKDTEKKGDAEKFSGKYIQAIGRRKTAVAQVRLYEDGKGSVVVNGIKLSKYFPGDSSANATQAMKLTSHLRDVNVSVVVRGGGKSGQVEAVRHGISRALLKMDENNRAVLSAADLLTRDKRKVERKKPGLRKARKSPQWSKR